MSTDLNKCYVTKSGSVGTPRGRMFFCAVAEKFLSKADKAKGKTVEDDGAYIVTICVPPDSDLTLLKQACKAKAIEKWPALPGNLKTPIRKCKEIYDKDGEAKYPEEMAEWWQITANTYKQQPGVVDSKGNPVNKLQAGESKDDVMARMKDECYSGRWGRITVQPSNYDRDGNRGTKLYLQNVQVLEHDEAIGGRSSSAEDDFVSVGAESADGEKASADSLYD